MNLPAVTAVRQFACLALLHVLLSGAEAQPQVVDGRVRFLYTGEVRHSVSLVGDFNGWSKGEDTLAGDGQGHWTVVKFLRPGIYQYKFVVDGSTYATDPHNPVTVQNYNRTSENSVFALTENMEIMLTAVPPPTKANPTDEYPSAGDKKPVYLNIIWHQHQPLYVNPEKDQLSGPWVRTHATKDYYDMAAMLRAYPSVHCTINLTSTLLFQLQEFYVRRLKPYVDTKNNRVNTGALWSKWKGKTDPWIDIALKPAEKFDTTDKDYLYRNAWNAFGISEVMLARFPEYQALKNKITPGQMPGDDLYTTQELREIKFWFYLAYFDPDFLLGPVVLPDSSVCDLSDYVEFRADGKFYLKKAITESDCNRMVAEAWKVMSSIIPIHRELRFSPGHPTGQVEVITTPYAHPILPLIYDSDLARTCQPGDALPPRFSYPLDAEAQVAKAVMMYREIFGEGPTGMWPGEGSVAQPILNVFRTNGILWTASDAKILARSLPANQPNITPYQFPAGATGPLSLVFRDTELSDRIGFKYQDYAGENAAEDFVRTLLERAPSAQEEDMLVTVILDGENAWEWYKKDVDGKQFLNAFYRKLSRLFADKRIITTTTTEYINGNSSRGIPPHSTRTQPAMQWLWPGSWINGNFDTWIGEKEENAAWGYLLRTRQDLERSGLPQPDPQANPPKEGTKHYFAYRAWEEMYAAEGSDWFWWYGEDQTAPGGDRPFDIAFITHLNNVYKFARQAGSQITSPGFPLIIQDRSSSGGTGPAPSGGGTMSPGSNAMQTILLQCDASAASVSRAIYVAGNMTELGAWTPNAVAMYDDGTHGDVRAGDGIWSLQIDVPVGTELQYKFTNSGKKGEWSPGEEFPGRHRTYQVSSQLKSPIIISDTFGK